MVYTDSGIRYLLSSGVTKTMWGLFLIIILFKRCRCRLSYWYFQVNSILSYIRLSAGIQDKNSQHTKGYAGTDMLAVVCRKLHNDKIFKKP